MHGMMHPPGQIDPTPLGQIAARDWCRVPNHLYGSKVLETIKPIQKEDDQREAVQGGNKARQSRTSPIQQCR